MAHRSPRRCRRRGALYKTPSPRRAAPSHFVRARLWLPPWTLRRCCCCPAAMPPWATMPPPWTAAARRPSLADAWCMPERAADARAGGDAHLALLRDFVELLLLLHQHLLQAEHRDDVAPERVVEVAHALGRHRAVRHVQLGEHERHLVEQALVEARHAAGAGLLRDREARALQERLARRRLRALEDFERVGGERSPGAPISIARPRPRAGRRRRSWPTS